MNEDKDKAKLKASRTPENYGLSSSISPQQHRPVRQPLATVVWSDPIVMRPFGNISIFWLKAFVSRRDHRLSQTMATQKSGSLPIRRTASYIRISVRLNYQ